MKAAKNAESGIAIIFDMDGVLIDSEPNWKIAEVEIFRELGVPLTEAMTQQTTGLRMDACVEYWRERGSCNPCCRTHLSRPPSPGEFTFAGLSGCHHNGCQYLPWLPSPSGSEESFSLPDMKKVLRAAPSALH